MKSYDVIRQAVDEPGVKAVAAALRVSPALVYKWCEPPADEDDPEQSGARNPLDRVREMFLLTKDIRLVRWLCNEAGGFFVSNPVSELRKSLDENIFSESRGMVREFSELLDTITESVEDKPGIVVFMGNQTYGIHTEIWTGDNFNQGFMRNNFASLTRLRVTAAITASSARTPGWETPSGPAP